MERSRVKDWLLGAAGAVLLVLAAVAVLWWAVTEPPGESDAGPASSSTAGGGAAVRDQPPADLDQDAVWLADLALEAGTVVSAEADLRDVTATGRDVLTGPDGLVAAEVTAEATVPFEVVAEELGGDSTVRAADDGQASVVRSVEALGRELRVAATGTVEVESGRVVVEPRHIDIGGPAFLGDAIAAAVRRLVTIEHEVEGLPEGLVLQDVAVRDDGFRVQLEGQDVRLLP